MNKFFIFFLTFILTLISIAHADVSISGLLAQDTFDACGTYQKQLIITNGDQVVHYVTLSASATFVTLAPDQIALPPNGQVIVYLFIAAPCKDQHSTFDITLSVDQQKSKIPQDYTFTIPKNATLLLPTNYVQACPCTAKTIPFTIINTGRITDAYQLTSSNDAATFSQNVFALVPNTTARGNITLNYACDVSGNKTTTIYMQSQLGIKQEIPIIYDITPCYDFTVDHTPNITTCYATQFPITITNPQHFDNSYKIKVGSQEYNVDVAKNSSNKALIYFNATHSTLQNIVTTSNLGNFKTTTQVNITVPTCTVDLFNVTTANNTLKLSLTNNGLDVVYIQVLDTSGIIYNNTIRLSNNTKISLPIANDSATYTIEFYKDQKLIDKVVINPRAVDYTPFIIIVVIVLILILLLLIVVAIQNKLKSLITQPTNKKKQSKKELKNTQTMYRASSSRKKQQSFFGNWWIYLLAAIIFLAIATGIYVASQYLDVSSFFVPNDDQNATIQTWNTTINMTNSSTTISNITNTSIKPTSNQTNISNQTNTTNQTRPINQTKPTTNVVNTTNVTDINQSVTPLTRNEILLATLQEAKQLMGENKSVLFIESNVTDSINLSWYFYDPENSTLKFAIIPLNMSNVSYNLTGEILSITPGDYIGIQTLQISAKDTLNATTTSPVIYLVVAPIQDALQGYFIAGFIVLLAIILIVSFDVWIMRRNYKKQLEMQKVIDPNKDAPIESTLPKSEDADKEVIDNTDSDKDDSKQPKNP